MGLHLYFYDSTYPAGQNSIFLMAYIIKVAMKIITSVLLCCTLALIGQGSQVPFTSLNFTVPYQTYPIKLTAGDELNASLSWAQAGLDLDVYLYPEGVDLLGQDYLDSATSQDMNPEVLIHTVQVTGNYYLKVDIYTPVITNYTFIVTINGTVVIEDSRIGFSHVFTASMVEFSTTNACMIKAYFEGPPSLFYIFPPGSNANSEPGASFDNTTSFELPIPQSGTWAIVLIHMLQSANYTNFTLNLKTYSDNACLSTPIPFSSFSTQIPALVYPIMITPGILKVSVYWTDPNSDFDLYFYNETQDVTTREAGETVSRNGYLEAAISYVNNPQVFTYNVTTAATYYVRVELFSPTIAQYKLVMEHNNQLALIDQGVAVPPEVPATIKQIKTTTACRAKVTYDGPMEYPIYVFPPGSTLSNTSAPTYQFINQTDFHFDLTSSGAWTVAVVHNITSNFTGPNILPIQLAVSTFSEAQCTSPEEPFASFTSSHPNMIYPLTLKAGDKIKATCSWPNNSVDFDIYLYQQGQDLLTREPGDTVSRNGYLDAVISTNVNPEVLQYTVNAAGTYYVRAELYTMAVAAFKLVLEVNGKVVRTEYEAGIPPEYPLTLKQFDSNKMCKVKVYYTGPLLGIMVFAPNSNLSSPPTYVFYSPQFEIDANIAGIWTIAIYHNITSTTTLTPFTLVVKTPSTSKCLNRCTGISNLVRLATGTSNVCILNCNHTNVQHLDVVDAEAVNKCDCEQRFDYHQQKAQCLANCNSIPFGNGAGNKLGVCSCKSNHHFDTYYGDCLVNCTSLPNSAGAADNDLNTCKCKDKHTYVNLEHVCRIQCHKVDNALTKHYKDDECACNVGYVWNASLVKCASVCGDGIKTSDEQCDDGNLNDKDGCSSQCTGEVTGLIIGASIAGGVLVIALAVVAVIFAKTGAAAGAAGGAAGASGQAQGVSSQNIIRAEDPPFKSIE